MRAPGCVVDLGAHHARRAPQALFDEPEARRAAHALEDQRRFAALLERKLFLPERLARRGRLGAGLVVAVEACGCDGPSHRLAPGAAELALRTEHNGAARTVRRRQAAMKAGLQSGNLRGRAPRPFDADQYSRSRPG